MIDLFIAQTGGDFSLDTLVQWGPLAVVLALIVTGKLAPGWVVDRLEKNNDELRSENKELRDKTETEVIPALLESTRIISSLVEKGQK
jgi:hypothetical protein